MQLGLIGLGKMGGNMAQRLKLGGHQVVGFDFNAEAVARLTASGSLGVASIEELTRNLKAPRAIWIMVPQGSPVDDTIAKLEPHLNPGDILIDGGNSNYKDSMRRHGEVTAKGFHFVDVGTSGGVWGLKEGYSMMIGGDKEPVEYLRPIFEALAPAPDKGWGHVGPAGAGHFVKMVHNGIEYGLMQAYAEGFSILKQKDRARSEPGADCRNLALRQRGPQLAARPHSRGARSAIPLSRALTRGSTIPARGAGRFLKPSTSTSRPPSSPNRFCAASARASRTISATACWPSCATPSAAMR